MKTKPRLFKTLLFAVCCLAPLVMGVAAAAGEEPPAAKAASVDVHLSEYAIAMPKTLPAGPVTFVLHNDGRKTHSFKIEGPGVDELLEKLVPPQQTGEMKVTLQPGDYKIYCPIGSHSIKGMTTTLTVTKKEG
ncbi:MAG TPA: cupredoxin domain-containing protein [Thermoanaerobaculia bacterium]|nr:cupredoxin domain-containing protein [Thermoanaerobaculia bacterium]